MGLFTAIASFLGAAFSAVGTTGCFLVWVDEPEMPKCMIEK